MIDTKFQSLLEENSKLNSLLYSQKAILEKCKTENNNYRQVYEELKEEYEQAKNAQSELSLKYYQLYDQKKEYEHEFETTIKNLKQTIEEKQLEIEEISAKAMPSFDYNMIRIRIINELNQPHQEQLEEKDAEIEKLTNELNEQKKNFLLQIEQAQISKEETNRNMGYLKDKFRDSIKELEDKIVEQQQKLDDNKDKETIKKLKRDLDD